MSIKRRLNRLAKEMEPAARFVIRTWKDFHAVQRHIWKEVELFHEPYTLGFFGATDRMYRELKESGELMEMPEFHRLQKEAHRKRAIGVVKSRYYHWKKALKSANEDHRLARAYDEVRLLVKHPQLFMTAKEHIEQFCQTLPEYVEMMTWREEIEEQYSTETRKQWREEIDARDRQHAERVRQGRKDW